ncbi:MAG TPA: N-acetylmuramic acid 6-phosphate etherase [Gemmataceae bacterium]|nr:N-acetylmuramic acid 6-phosphate etherase [Gemmataceae bacterium]
MDHLQTEARNPASTKLDELTALEIVRLMNAEDGRVVPAVASQAEAIARAVEVIAERLRAGGRLIYVGAGTSGRLGVLDASECPPTFNSPPEQVIGVIAGGLTALTRAVEGAEDHPEYGERDLESLGVSSRDAVVGIATSGRTPYVLGAVAYARRQGAFTAGIACNEDAELNSVVDVPIVPVVGPEVVSGSTRLKAGTATKLVLNMLSTGAMVLLGKTYGNLMVDLRASNSKLRARTNRIVRILTGLSSESADALLRRCGGELKTALVAQLSGVEPEEARSRLVAAGDQVRQALFHQPMASGVALAPREDETLRAGEELYLGIDGGGTHTVALLASRDAAILGRGTAGPSNRQAVGKERALAALDEAVSAAFTAAGVTRGPVVSACLGLAGADRPDDRSMIREWTERVGLADRVEVTNDAAILLAAGTPQGWGLALIAGTGSIAFGQSADGRRARAGGWGYLLGDEGSAYALVMAGLQAVVRAADRRGPATRLTERFLNRWSLNQPQDLVAAVYRSGRDRADFAALAPVVLEAAEEDAVAAEIVEQAARELARSGEAVLRQLHWEGPVPLALAGGLLLGSEVYRQRVLHALTTLGVQPEPIALVEEPARGAIKLAIANIHFRA